MTSRHRHRVVIRGIVQGVGFRPAMHRHAASLGLAGFVGNDGAGVFVEVEGELSKIDAFVEGLAAAAPPLAVIDDVAVTELAAGGAEGFRIVDSDTSASTTTLVAPDIAPCDDCLAELLDPADRRYRYPFVNCTNCGPRYSIVRSVPYDRATTTMAGFVMCAGCAAEYEDPSDRRFHAEPTCCPACGPSLTLRTRDAVLGAGDVIGELVARLREGSIAAVKGLGGYHLACDARNEEAVASLRSRKDREEKPFALLVGSVEEARAIADVSAVEADLLVDPARPIVLLARRVDAGVAPSVAPRNGSLGAMLAPTPLHVLLVEAFGGPLVLTSGNRSSEPIVTDDDDAIERLDGIADVFCTHDRPIHVRVDDSVTRVVGDRQIVIRRARGLAPRPARVLARFPRHTLACGAQLKSTVCLGRDDVAFVSQHLGDLENHETYLAFRQAVDHLGALFGVDPMVVAHDLHPDMASTAHAQDLAAAEGLDLVGVQHHHAHIASCLADNEADGPVIGLAFDGLGLGVDGTLWGGEVLHADLARAARLGHLASVPMPGGDMAVREPWRMALAHLAGVLEADALAVTDVFERNRERWDAVASMVRSGVNAPLTSSVGRLFDAVAAIVGVRDEVTYEGQAAIELEQAVDLTESGSYPVAISADGPFLVDTGPIVRGVADDVRAGVAAPTVAGRFHNAVVDLMVAAARRARETTGLATVALSGGVFQNALLLARAVPALSGCGFEVLTHRRFPANDGGISLGQAVVVAGRDRVDA